MEYKANRQHLRYWLIAVIPVVFLTFRHCGHPADKAPQTPRDYAAIAQEGILRATVECSPVSYHAEGDSVSGFDYELIHTFAQEKGLKIEFIPKKSFDRRLKGLSSGEFDLIASGIPNTRELKDSLRLTLPLMLSRQVLVQRRKDDSLHIRSQLDLAGQTLHVVKGSPVIPRIQNLGEEIADTIYIKEIAKCTPQRLIAQVADGKIDYAVCDEHIAQAVADSFPQVDISTAISFTQFYSWAVSKQSPDLADSLNSWLGSFMKTKEYRDIYRRYHRKGRK